LDKDRPVVIISVDSLNRHALNVCVVPFTSVRQGAFLQTRIQIPKGDGGAKYDCWATCDAVTTLLKTRLRFPALGVLSTEKMKEIEDKVRLSLGLLQS